MSLKSPAAWITPSSSSTLSTTPDNYSFFSMSYFTSQEMKCVLHWFANWSDPQRERFLQDLVAKAVPGKLQPLLEGLEQLSVSGADRPPHIFDCQLRLWDQWFRSWAEEERNEFVRQLEANEPDFVAKFYQAVAATAALKRSLTSGKGLPKIGPPEGVKNGGVNGTPEKGASNGQ